MSLRCKYIPLRRVHCDYSIGLYKSCFRAAEWNLSLVHSYSRHYLHHPLPYARPSKDASNILRLKLCSQTIRSDSCKALTEVWLSVGCLRAYSTLTSDGALVCQKTQAYPCQSTFNLTYSGQHLADGSRSLEIPLWLP